MSTFDTIRDIIEDSFPHCYVEHLLQRGFQLYTRPYCHGIRGRKITRYIDSGATREAITRKLESLTAEAERIRAADAAEDARRLEEDAAAEEREAARRKDWKGKLRIARGGYADLPLEGAAAYALPNGRLVDAGTTGKLTLDLPTDLDARAAFLSALDRFVTEQQAY